MSMSKHTTTHIHMIRGSEQKSFHILNHWCYEHPAGGSVKGVGGAGPGPCSSDRQMIIWESLFNHFTRRRESDRVSWRRGNWKWGCESVRRWWAMKEEKKCLYFPGFPVDMKYIYMFNCLKSSMDITSELKQLVDQSVSRHLSILDISWRLKIVK